MTMLKPILFNTEMVRAILDGRKTQTRRKIPIPNYGYFMHVPTASIRPPYQVGDILWVRETWQQVFTLDVSDQPIEGTDRYIYYADNPMPFGYWVDTDTGEHKDQMPWEPSIHMPKEAARIFLRVTNVRVEQLQDITTDDCLSEGIDKAVQDFADAMFAVSWDRTIKKPDLSLYGWKANPWVWVIEFERCEKPEGWCA